MFIYYFDLPLLRMFSCPDRQKGVCETLGGFLIMMMMLVVVVSQIAF